MNLRIIQTIFRKELLDTLRDKRTLIALLGVPAILYPALFIFATQAALVQAGKLRKTPSRVAVQAEEPSAVREWVKAIELVDVRDSENPIADLQEGLLDAVVSLEPQAERRLREGGSATITIEFDAAETRSRTAAHRLTEGLRKQKERLLDERLARADLGRQFVEPLVIKEHSRASPTKLAGSILGAVLPLIMVVMVGVGAFYPAVDLTAGEKERGTFETLLSTPAGKLEIVAGKFLAVFCLAMITGLLNLGSMMLTFAFQLAQLPSEWELVLEVRLPPQTALVIGLVLIPLAFFIAAAMMSIAVFARNFKEAQNYVGPFFLLITFPAVLAAIPGAELSAATQFIPIANVALLFKSLMMEKLSIEAVFAVLISTTAYAVLALVAAAWIFQREEVILYEERGIPITLRRAQFLPRKAPTTGMAFFLFGLTLLLLFYVGLYVQRREPLSGLLLTEWGVILGPVMLLCWYARVDLIQGLNLRLPSARSVVATVIFMIPWTVLLLQIGAWHNRLLPIPEALELEWERLIGDIQVRAGTLGAFLVLAVSPALCEETLFRGAILSALRNRLPFWAGLLLVGLLFGAIHLDIYRLIPATLSGIVLTYLVWRSGSLFLGILGHFLINANALLLEFELAPEWVQANLKVLLKQDGTLPLWLLGSAALLFLIGIGAIEWWTPRKNSSEDL